MRGRDKVSTYFGNYAREDQWRLAPGLVEGRPAALYSCAMRPPPFPSISFCSTGKGIQLLRSGTSATRDMPWKLRTCVP